MKFKGSVPRNKKCTLLSGKFNIIFTARIQRMGKVMFSQVSVCSHKRGWAWYSSLRIFPPFWRGPGYPSPRFFCRYPQPGRGTPGPGQDGVPPRLQTGQQSEHLLRGGRYGSCVHAGQLSCLGRNMQVQNLLDRWYASHTMI